MFRFLSKKDGKEFTLDIDSGCYYDPDRDNFVVGCGTEYGALLIYDYEDDIITEVFDEDEYVFLGYEKPSDSEIEEAKDLYDRINPKKIVYFLDRESDIIFGFDPEYVGREIPEFDVNDDNTPYFKDKNFKLVYTDEEYWQ